MLFKDAISKENLRKYYVKTETNAKYIVGNTPVQMCQFHQSAIIRRYLTKKPKLKAAQELLKVVDFIKQTDKESFEGALQLWHENTAH